MKKNFLYAICFLAGAVVFNVIPSCGPEGTGPSISRTAAGIICDSLKSLASLQIDSISVADYDSAAAAYDPAVDSLMVGTFITRDVANILFSMGADTIFTRLVINPAKLKISADYVGKSDDIVGILRPDYVPTCPTYCCPAY